MLVTLEEARMYCRLDSDIEDEFLELLIKNAEYYIEDTVDYLNLENEKIRTKAKLLAQVLISDWYENRSYMYDKRESPDVRYTVRSLVMQLQSLSLEEV